MGKNQDDGNDQAAHRKLPMLGVRAEQRRRGEKFLQRNINQRAEHRAVQPAHAAEYYHHQDDSGLVPRQDIRIDETELARGESSG